MLELKKYQQQALQALEGFFKAIHTDGLQTAWSNIVGQDAGNKADAKVLPYDGRAFGDTPCVCLRLPTGGGKTLLSAHALARTGKAYLNTDTPVALWLVPSDTILKQTLEALSNARHPYRSALTGYYGDNVRVCALDDLAGAVMDVGRKAIVVVATIQSFRIADTKATKRNVYDFDEDFAPNFQHLTPQQTARLEVVTEADLKAQPFLTEADLGRPKASVANWFHLHRPIVIVDEAHNSRTHTSFATLKRLDPACIIEMTATPVPGSNVLYHVSALELKNQSMIKLPIVLAEHPQGWQDAVRDALLNRKRLETLAQREPDYIRPIVLFQAQPKGGEVTVEVLKEHLIGQGEVREEEIAVATGTQKELDKINLLDPACPIRCVLTVEALKEGWDCPFAYVLCSLQESRSAKDVEQLLGRVLRMPYATARTQQALNKAYAHIVAESFAEVANRLTDRMVNNMGFEPYEAATAFVPFEGPDLFGDDPGKPALPPRLPEAIINLPTLPTEPLPQDIADKVEIRPTSQGATVIVRGELTPEIEYVLIGTQPPKYQDKVQEQIQQQRARQDAARAPSVRGEMFAPLPQLVFWEEDEPILADRELLTELGELDLLSEPAQLAGFAVYETANTFEIDIDDKRLRYNSLDPRQLALNTVPSNATDTELVRWLDREVRQIDITQPDMLLFLTALVRHLLADRGFTLTALVRAKFQLADAIRAEIKRRRGSAVRAGFQKALPQLRAASLEDGFSYTFEFKPNRYPARSPFYSGRYRFSKHYYPEIHDLRDKTLAGRVAEEFICAQAIDSHPQVKHWVRNVEGNAQLSFWFPTASDYFYPDFVCELHDGRLLVVEYKGEPYKTNDDSREKKQIGYQWEASSGGRCLFLFAVAEDEAGRSVQQQVDDKISL